MKQYRAFFFAAGCMFAAVFCPALFAQTTPVAAIINPKPGTWANKQMLVLDVPRGCEVFYSFAGSNPLESGFAYDGPVLIDADGPVMLRLTTVAPNFASLEQTVTYTVRETPPPPSLERYAQGAVLTEGTSIELPAEFLYCLGNDTMPKFGGRTLELAAFYPERFIPCTVDDGNALWRFVITVKFPEGSEDGAGTEPPQLPFTITNWTRLEFLPNQYMYCIDGGAWKPARGRLDLDRTARHIVEWRNAENKADNQIHTYVIPAKPNADLIAAKKGYVIKPYYTDRMASNARAYLFTAPQAGVYQMVEEIPVDALFGEELSTVMTLNAYYNGVYQGSIDVPFMLDNRPPDTPGISSTRESFFTRGPVSVTITQSEQETVFYTIETMRPRDSYFAGRPITTEELPQKPKAVSPFLRYGGTPIVLNSRQDGRDSPPEMLDGETAAARRETNPTALVYSIFAYAEDESGNKSDYTAYHVLVDPINYYLTAPAPDSAAEAEDGSVDKPFTSLKKALEAIARIPNVSLHIQGDVLLSEPVTIDFECEFVGSDKTRIRLTDDAQIIFKGSNFRAQSIWFEKNSMRDSPYIAPVFELNNAFVDFNDCIFVGAVRGNAALFALTHSSIAFESCVLSLAASDYGAAVTGSDSIVYARESTVVVDANTAVGFSLGNSVFTLLDSRFSAAGPLARAAELVRSTFRITGNRFTLKTNTPVWFDRESVPDALADNAHETILP